MWARWYARQRVDALSTTARGQAVPAMIVGGRLDDQAIPIQGPDRDAPIYVISGSHSRGPNRRSLEGARPEVSMKTGLLPAMA
jgi:hypothetical protein